MNKRYKVIITAVYNNKYVFSDYEISMREMFEIKGAIIRLNVYSALEKPKALYPGSYNWEKHKDKLYKEEREGLEKFLPKYYDYDNDVNVEIHTIVSVKIFEIPKEEELIK